MTWVYRLLRRLTSAWSRDPLALLAFTVTCDGSALASSVANGVLTLTPTGGSASVYQVQLGSYATIYGLTLAISAQQGYTATLQCTQPWAAFSPLGLVEGQGQPSTGPTQTFSLAQSLHYLILQAIGAELCTAETQIPFLPLQMAITTATQSWLDYLGGFYSVLRIPQEGDAAYAIRIVQETIRPKCNNQAIAAALQAYTGVATQVTDVINYGGGINLCNGAFTCNGSHTCSAGTIVATGGFFDVEGGFDLISGTDLSNLAAVLTGYINRLKAAGTQLRNLILAPLSNLRDAGNVPAETDAFTITYSGLCNGAFTCNGSSICAGGLTWTGSLEGAGAFS